MTKNRTIGLTGATGLIGKALRSQINTPMYLVIRSEVEDLKDNETILRGSFSDIQVIEEFASRVDVIIHAASSVAIRSDYAEGFVKDDLVGTIELAKIFFEKNPTGHFIYLSTSGGIYDLEDHSVKNEDSEILPKNMYGSIKLIIEGALENIVKPTGKVTVFRPAAVYGDLFRKNLSVGLIDKLLKSAHSKTMQDVVTVFDKLESSRDYLHTEDLASAIIAVFDRQGSPYEVYNVGTGKGHSIESVIKLIENVIEEKVKVNIVPVDSKATSLLLDSSKLTEATGWRSKIDLRSGIIKMYEDLKKRNL